MGGTDPTYLDIRLTVITDQIQMEDWSIEAPYVGNSMSTSQLYLLSNCGNQWFNNDLNNTVDLDAVMVSAVIHNSFSVGLPITGSGDAPTMVTGCDLSHLEYRLVDSNYVPIKLQSPMFLTLKVDAAEDPAKDVSMWKGKLPRDAPLNRRLRCNANKLNSNDRPRPSSRRCPG
jgi:hypothetical protein